MNMQGYLNEITYAVESALSAIWADTDKLNNIQNELERLTRETERGYQRAQAFQYDEDPDDVMMGIGIHWNTYFGPDKERHQVETSINDLKERFRVHDFSRNAMSASVLQYAKQGISIVHGGLQACPDGRAFGIQVLKTVIWQGRNQSLHWEEGNPRQPVVDCFDQLAQNFDSKFFQYRTSNLAFDVVKLLDWKSYYLFEKDMQSLA